MITTNRKYGFTNADLMMIASNFVTFMTRDTTEFAVRGVTTIDITDFQALGNAFEVFPTDDVFRADVTIASNAKTAARNTTILNIQTISSFFEQQWGLESPQYTKLRIKGMHSVSDNSFLVSARAVTIQATAELATLTPIGLTQAMIDNLTTDAQTFEDKLNEIADAEATREIKTIERTNNGNELYSFVQKYSKIGKGIWENVNQAKFDNYIISPTVQSALGKVQNLAGVFIPAVDINPAQVDLSWNAVAGATEYIVFRSIVPINSPSATFIDIATVSITQHMDLDLVNAPGEFYYKVRAITATEAGADSDEANVQVV